MYTSSTMDDVLPNVKKRQLRKEKKKQHLLCKVRSWVGNDGGFVVDGVKGWVKGLWNVSGLVGLKLLRIFAVDIIVWISWIKSAFVIDGKAIWRTVNRILIVSILAMGFKVNSSFDGFCNNWGAFLRKYWIVVCINKS